VIVLAAFFIFVGLMLLGDAISGGLTRVTQALNLCASNLREIANRLQ
jgi:hypothetical protein